MKVVAALLMAALFGATPVAVDARERDYRELAREAARWIRSTAIESEGGFAWPADPADPKSVVTNLYSGAAGVVLFFLEAHHASGDAADLQDARRGADFLLARLDREESNGLYVGLAGMGFALYQTYKATGDRRYEKGARRAVELLSQRARRVGRGVEWGAVTDIVSGNAGTGLFLLYAARQMKMPEARRLAIDAGLRMIEVGQPAEGGLKWAMEPKFPRLMPNFSHGTAGNAYFLATLYRETRRREFLDAALAGARYLQAVATVEGDACLIFHHEPEGENLFYLGWCHGPAGTARLFYQLYKATGERKWMDWVERLARGVMKSGVPEKRTPGFWNNVGQCCGSAGVAEFFLDLYRVTKKRDYLDFSRRMTDDVLSRATRVARGVRWVQAEHRVRPEQLAAQTGYMQGAAGIGMWLLHLDAFERRRAPRIQLPDTPFAR